MNHDYAMEALEALTPGHDDYIIKQIKKDNMFGLSIHEYKEKPGEIKNIRRHQIVHHYRYTI